MRKNNLLRATGGLSVIALGAFLLVPPAIAQDDGKVSIGFARYVEPSPDEPRWVVCYSVDFGAKKNYVGSIIATKYRDTLDNNGDVRWREKLKEQFDLDKSLYGGCNIEKSAKDAQWRYGVFVEFHPTHPKELILVDWQMKPPAAKGKSKGAGASARRGKSATEPTAEKPASPKYVEVAGPDGLIRLSPEVVARNKAAADDYRRKMDQHAQSLAEHDQRLAQHRQNAATAASAENQHKREVAAAGERYAAYRVAMADHARKVAGASTNDDPNTCITRPEFRSNDGFPGNTSASVINGCPQKVDIVLCLKRSAGDWTCGAKFGILTQGKMSYATRNATGEIFVDAITYGGGGKLKRPAGM